MFSVHVTLATCKLVKSAVYMQIICRFYVVNDPVQVFFVV